MLSCNFTSYWEEAKSHLFSPHSSFRTGPLHAKENLGANRKDRPQMNKNYSSVTKSFISVFHFRNTVNLSFMSTECMPAYFCF